jgi:hypothetical protein
MLIVNTNTLLVCMQDDTSVMISAALVSPAGSSTEGRWDWAQAPSKLCDLNSQTNLLSNCVTSTLGQAAGSRAFTGVVVSGSDAWVTNEAASPCSLLYCSNATAMSGCSCVAGTSGITLSQAKGISLSPAKNKIYVQGTVSGLTEGIVVCNITNSALSCITYSLTNTGLTGMYATGTKLYTFVAGNKGNSS